MRNPFLVYRDIIPAYAAFEKCLNHPLEPHVRVNRLKAEPGEVASTLRRRGVQLQTSYSRDDCLYAAPDLESPGNLPEYFLGSIHPQAFTSCLAAPALSPEPHACVLDMCAAPGGKTAHMADLMENTGLIVANELYADRQRSLGHTLDRLGVLNAVITGYQAQEFPTRQTFDFVLADVPCSGEGTFRTAKPGAVFRKPRNAEYLPGLQKKIILHGYDLLNPGGRMLYATCTYNPEENEGVVDHLLKQRDADLLPIKLDCEVDPGITGWKQSLYDKRLERSARFYPHRTRSVGFFMARIGKPE
ncbi:MAG: RsmB/NOP family class I SAM-dependent RNA methyltransferase [Deltaproteobacteria bacterium]|nr:RsmB/NOP family class I SAM-dependent RNA methyltransferase [Deltaproteobacteria bacterium]MBW2285334.1 RsmB/NOP family class I SAM-dependent RNA methyltransferase [Deltaproteobacteria bacterium]